MDNLFVRDKKDASYIKLEQASLNRSGDFKITSVIYKK